MTPLPTSVRLLAAGAFARRSDRSGVRNSGSSVQWLAHSVGWARLPLLCLGLLLALGCARPKPPVVTPHAATVSAITPEAVLLNVLLKVENPNAFSIAARSVSGTLRVTDGPRLGTGQAAPDQAIGAGKTALVESQVRIRWSDLAVLAPLLLKPTLPYTFDGTVTLGGSAIELTLPFALEGELTREQLLGAGLRGLPKLPALLPTTP